MKKLFLSLLALAAAGVLVYFLSGGDDSGDSDTPATEKGKPHRRLISEKGNPSVARSRIDTAWDSMTNRTSDARKRVWARPKSGAGVEEDWTDEDGKPWPSEQLALMRSIHKAAENEDFGALAGFADDVSKCPNPELREKFVDELGWFGDRAFVELVGFLGDSSEDVVNAARTHLVDAFQDSDNDAEKAAVMTTLGKTVGDRDLLESLADELMSMDELLALQTIADVIDSGTDAAKSAVAEIYETITEEKWTGIDAAERWLEENYDGQYDEDTGGDAVSGNAETGVGS